MKDFFISYNKADKNRAEWIASQLKTAGYSIIIQAWDSKAGSNFIRHMDEAIKNARRTIAILSPEYLRSRFTQAEWSAAFANDPTGEQGLLIPIKIKKCQITGLLSSIVYIDLVGLGDSEAKEVLLKEIKRRTSKTERTVSSEGSKSIETKFPQQAWRNLKLYMILILVFAGLFAIIIKIIAPNLNENFLNVTVNGIVVDKGNNEPIPDAVITIDGLSFYAESGYDGIFAEKLSDVIAGETITLRLKHPEYHYIQKDTTIDSTRLNLKFYLNRLN